MRALSILPMGLILSGCIVQPQTPEQIAALPFDSSPEPQVVCRREKPTGSNRVQTICRRVLTTEEEARTLNDMRRMQRQSEGFSGNR